jgi:hypothetical protein
LKLIGEALIIPRREDSRLLGVGDHPTDRELKAPDQQFARRILNARVGFGAVPALRTHLRELLDLGEQALDAFRPMETPAPKGK